MDSTAKIAGRWNYADSETPHQYGELESYLRSAKWLDGCPRVEDRGCGCAFARQFFTTHYWGVDGTPSPWTDEVVDLMTYRRKVPGLLMRHVLEHNFKWCVLLENALEDFTQRMALVIHIPLAPFDEYLAPAVFSGGEVPNIRLCRDDLLRRLLPYLRGMEELDSGETCYYLQK